MFSWFSRREPPLVLRVAEVNNWLRSYQESIGLDHHLTVFKAEMKRHVKHLMELADLLSEEDLSGEDSPATTRGFARARKGLVNEMQSFIMNTRLPTTYEELVPYAERESERVEAFDKAIRPHVYELQQRTQAAVKVLRVAQALDETITEFRSVLMRLDKDKVDEAYRRVDEYYRMLDERERLQRALEPVRARREEERGKYTVLEEKIRKQEGSRGVGFTKELYDELSAAEEALEKKRQALKRKFSPLRKAWKEAGTKSEWAQRYMDDVVEAIMADGKNDILKAIGALQRRLDKLGLDKKEKEKASKACDKVTKEWLESEREAVKTMNDNVDGIQSRIKRDPSLLALKEKYAWKEAAEERMEELDRELERLEGELERLSPRLYLQWIRDSLKRLKENVDLEELRDGR